MTINPVNGDSGDLIPQVTFSNYDYLPNHISSLKIVSGRLIWINANKKQAEGMTSFQLKNIFTESEAYPLEIYWSECHVLSRVHLLSSGESPRSKGLINNTQKNNRG